MIAQALRAQALGFAGDVVLRWVSLAAFAMSLSLATSIPQDFMDAPAEIRESLAAPLNTVLATYGAVLAAVYGSFRYTIDRRDGVVAQRLMLQSRWVTLLVRVPASAVGGAIVALAGVVGGHAALALSMGGIPAEVAAIGSALALGAVTALWGMGLGILVRSHLVALFVVSLSMGAAILVAMFWNAGAAYLPLLALLAALRFDVAAGGITPQHSLDPSVAVLVAVGWVLAALLAGGVSFLRRDVT